MCLRKGSLKTQSQTFIYRRFCCRQICKSIQGLKKDDGVGEILGASKNQNETSPWLANVAVPTEKNKPNQIHIANRVRGQLEP